MDAEASCDWVKELLTSYGASLDELTRNELALHWNSSAHGVILMASKTFRLCWVVTYSPLLQCTAIYAHTRPSGVEVGTRWDEWEGILGD